MKRFFLTLSLLVIVGACGVKLETENNVPLDISTLHQKDLCGISGEAASPLIGKVQLLRQNIENYFTTQGRYSPYLSYQNYRYYEATFQSPLILSEASFRRIYTEITSELRSFVTEEDLRWLQGESDFFPARMDFERLQLVMMKLNSLHQFINRWDNQKCQLENLSKKRKDDLQDYLLLKHKECGDKKGEECLENELAFYEANPGSAQGDVRDGIDSLCHRLFVHKLVCREKFEKALKEKALLAYYKSLSQQYEREIYNKYFGLNSEKKYQCERVKKGVQIFIPFYEGDPKTRDAILISLKRFWSRTDVRLLPTFEDAPTRETAVIIRGKKLSHVRSDRVNEIYLQDTLAGENLVRVLAHEFGHFLGFEDCYVEYYNSDTREIVYYELDSRNLMCSLSALSSLPTGYFDRLVEKSCDFTF